MSNIKNLENLLLKKKQTLRGYIFSTQKTLDDVNLKLEEAQNEEAKWQREMEVSYKSGIVTHDEIYNNLRRQGNIMHKQQVIHCKIIQFHEEIVAINKTLGQYKTELSKTEKKIKKIDFFLRRHFHENLIRMNGIEDDELQEIVVNDRKKHNKKFYTC
ncbi:hypothetical protein GE856_23660 [Salmonella enterica]|nr:hypothetical protein [Salmonella enterica]EEK4519644.1 hypothetical protein [Salmonella enterica]EIP9519707.1 hypothetical protein [Salmonella enterica]